MTRTAKHMTELTEEILRTFIEAAHKAGLPLRGVNDGEELVRVEVVDEAIDAIDSVEESTLVFLRENPETHKWGRVGVFIIPSNEGHCICDYHDIPEFEVAMKAVEPLVDKWEGQTGWQKCT